MTPRIYFQTKAYGDISQERRRAHDLHKDKGLSMEVESPDSPRWLPVLVEEIGEVARAMNDKTHLREELIQVAAMTTAWIDALDHPS